ncbi:MAG: response regulator [Pseudomonadota bacterium]
MSDFKGNKNCRFLIVDDQQQILMLLKGILKAGGYYRIATAQSAKDALKIVRAFSAVDFIICDWNMPNMTGGELLSMIRKNPSYCHLPFVMVTAENSKEQIVYALEEGVDGYLIKPITQQKTIKTIESILEQEANPKSKRNLIRKIHRFKLEKKYDEAIGIACQILDKVEDPETLLVLSECYLCKNDYENAKKQIQNSLKIKKDSRAFDLLATICIAETKHEEAIEHLKNASDTNPLNANRKISLGETYLKMGLADEAAKAFDSINASTITDLNFVDIGRAYLYSGDVEKAGKYLQNTADPIPETIPIFNKYAIELRKAGLFEESLKQYRKCCEIDPKSYTVRYNLGMLYTEMQRYREAEKEFEVCLELQPDSKDTKKLLSYLESKQGAVL